MIQSIYNTKATVKRRLDISIASRDILNNPVYGAPTQAPWQTIYSAMPCRFAFSSKPIQFAPTGERITPNGVCYLPPQYIIYHEDRILTANGIEYVVESIVPAFINNNVIDHWEADVELP
jgi:hypothetical protein